MDELREDKTGIVERNGFLKFYKYARFDDGWRASGKHKYLNPQYIIEYGPDTVDFNDQVMSVTFSRVVEDDHYFIKCTEDEFNEAMEAIQRSKANG